MKARNNSITGWTAIAAGIATLSLPFGLAVLSAIGSLDNIVGALGDVLGAIATLLIIPVLIAAGGIVMAKHKALGISAQVLGVIGALIDFTQYVLFIGGIITYEQSLPWNSTARGLIGIVVLTYGLLNRKDPQLKRL